MTICGAAPGAQTEPMAHVESFPPVVEILKRLGIWLDKKKSQHFLRSQAVCADIAELAELTRDAVAIEVGPGLGNLSVELSARAGRVLAVELDTGFADWHKYVSQSYPRIYFVYRDFLETAFSELLADIPPGTPLVGVGNLPYQITSEILFRFVNAERTFDRLVFMVQKEVADRICAGAGARAGGALTYKIALRYHARFAMFVGPENFLPPPKVDSAVIVLEPLAQPLVRDLVHRTQVYALLDGIFRYRRKTLLNCLTMAGIAPDKVIAARMLETAEVDAIRRPETLEMHEVIALAEAAQ